MCFSAAASFIVGTGLVGVGVVTIRKAPSKRDVPFASIPLLFGIQQISEGVVWMSLGGATEHVAWASTYVFTAFSHVIWPIFVPFAVLLLETGRTRRRLLGGTQLAGLAIGLFLLYSIIRYPITARVIDSSIDYESRHLYLPPVMTAYLAATVGSPLLSSHVWIRIFGALAFIGAIAAYAFWAATFISVWCFFAAVVSVAVYMHFARAGSHRTV